MAEDERIIEDQHGRPIARDRHRVWIRRNNKVVAEQFGDGPTVFHGPTAPPPPVVPNRAGYVVGRDSLPWR